MRFPGDRSLHRRRVIGNRAGKVSALPWTQPTRLLEFQSPGTSEEQQNGRGIMYKRALVVDDQPAVCDLIQKALLSAGLEALTLTRSAEAHSLLEEGKFDVVFLDLHMPSPDGTSPPQVSQKGHTEARPISTKVRWARIFELRVVDMQISDGYTAR